MTKSSTESRIRKPASNRKRNRTVSQPAATNSDSIGGPQNDALQSARIAEAAYYRAERRGFAPGFELEDWLLAEIELSAQTSAHNQQRLLRQSMPSSLELH